MRGHDIELKDYVGSALTLSATDGHPSALVHQLLGEFYAARLIELGLLD